MCVRTSETTSCAPLSAAAEAATDAPTERASTVPVLSPAMHAFVSGSWAHDHSRLEPVLRAGSIALHLVKAAALVTLFVVRQHKTNKHSKT